MSPSWCVYDSVLVNGNENVSLKFFNLEKVWYFSQLKTYRNHSNSYYSKMILTRYHYKIDRPPRICKCKSFKFTFWIKIKCLHTVQQSSMTIFYLLIFLIGLLGNQFSLSKLLLHDGHAILLSVAFILKHFAYPKIARLANLKSIISLNARIALYPSTAVWRTFLCWMFDTCNGSPNTW